MGKTTDEMKAAVDDSRDDFESNLLKLETRVKAATDWRGHFRRHSGTLLAAAFGGGMLLSSLIRSRQ